MPYSKPDFLNRTFELNAQVIAAGQVFVGKAALMYTDEGAGIAKHEFSFLPQNAMDSKILSQIPHLCGRGFYDRFKYRSTSYGHIFFHSFIEGSIHICPKGAALAGAFDTSPGAVSTDNTWEYQIVLRFPAANGGFWQPVFVGQGSVADAPQAQLFGFIAGAGNLAVGPAGTVNWTAVGAGNTAGGGFSAGAGYGGLAETMNGCIGCPGGTIIGGLAGTMNGCIGGPGGTMNGGLDGGAPGMVIWAPVKLEVEMAVLPEFRIEDTVTLEYSS
jgi:hypothetical protein